MGYKHEVSLSLNISSFRVNLADSSHPEWSKLAKAFLLKAQGEDSPTPQLLEGGSHNLQVKKQNQNTPPPFAKSTLDRNSQQYGTKSAKWCRTK